jgi:carboxylesterase type B
MTGCASVPRSQTISCLRKVDVQTIRDVSLAIDTLNVDTISHAWTPVIDGTFLRERLSTAIKNGKINPEYAFAVYNRHEGENFVSSALTDLESNDGQFNATEQGFNLWVSKYLPGFSKSQIKKLKDLYSGYGENGSYKRAADIYRDSVLACPALWSAKMTSKTKKKGWLVEFSVSPGKHASDTQYVGSPIRAVVLDLA